MNVQTLIRAGLITLIATACATKHSEQEHFSISEDEEKEESVEIKEKSPTDVSKVTSNNLEVKTTLSDLEDSVSMTLEKR